MAFLNETGLQELRARLEAVYARKANITAGTAGETTDTSGSSITIPYVTMNAQGVVTGYGTKTHTVPTPEPAVTPPTITVTNEQSSGYGWRACRLKIVITRTAASGTTYYIYNGQDSYNDSYSRPFSGSFTGASATIYTQYTTSRQSTSKISTTVLAATKVGNDQSLITIAGGTSNAGSCNCSCGCDCDCNNT